MRTVVLCVLFVPSIAAATHATGYMTDHLATTSGTLVYNRLHTFEPGTPPQVGLVGNLGLPDSMVGLAFDRASGVLYGATASSLYTFDLDTGQATRVTPLSISTLLGLAINPLTSEMHGISSSGQFSRINPITGEATIIGSPSGVQPGALACGPDGQFYMASGDTTLGGIYRIDPTTGVQTLLFTERRLSGMAFNPDDGVLYGVDNFRARSYIVDLSAGAFTVLGHVGGTINPRGLTFTPAPSAGSVILLAAASLSRRRRPPARRIAAASHSESSPAGQRPTPLYAAHRA